MLTTEMPTLVGRDVFINVHITHRITEVGDGTSTLGLELYPVMYQDNTYDIVSYNPRTGEINSVARKRQYGRPGSNPEIVLALTQAHFMPTIAVDSHHTVVIATFGCSFGRTFLTVHIGQNVAQNRDLITRR